MNENNYLANILDSNDPYLLTKFVPEYNEILTNDIAIMIGLSLIESLQKQTSNWRQQANLERVFADE